MKQQQQKHGSGTIIFYSFCHERMDGKKVQQKRRCWPYLPSFFLMKKGQLQTSFASKKAERSRPVLTKVQSADQL